MKKLIIIFVFIASTASAQLTLSQKSTLALNTVMRERVYQALFSKANYWIAQTVTNLQNQKQNNYARAFVKGAAGGIDANVVTNYWLAGYNTVPVLDGNGQPTDSEILNSAQLDTVFNTLAGVLPGENLLPIQ